MTSWWNDWRSCRRFMHNSSGRGHWLLTVGLEWKSPPLPSFLFFFLSMSSCKQAREASGTHTASDCSENSCFMFTSSCVPSSSPQKNISCIFSAKLLPLILKTCLQLHIQIYIFEGTHWPTFLTPNIDVWGSSADADLMQKKIGSKLKCFLFFQQTYMCWIARLLDTSAQEKHT